MTRMNAASVAAAGLLGLAMGGALFLSNVRAEMPKEGVTMTAAVPDCVAAPRRGEETKFEIGLTIANRTDKDLWFNLFDTVRPVLKDSQGLTLQNDGGRKRTTVPKPIQVKAGQTDTVRYAARLTIPLEKESPQIVVDDHTGGAWFYHDLAPGSYTLALEYTNAIPQAGRISDAVKRWLPDVTSETPLWVGKRSTAPAPFAIAAPDNAVAPAEHPVAASSRGRIAKIDGNDLTLHVLRGPSGIMRPVRLSEQTAVIRADGKPGALADLKVDQWIKVTFAEKVTDSTWLNAVRVEPSAAPWPEPAAPAGGALPAAPADTLIAQLGGADADAADAALEALVKAGRLVRCAPARRPGTLELTAFADADWRTPRAGRSPVVAGVRVVNLGGAPMDFHPHALSPMLRWGGGALRAVPEQVEKTPPPGKPVTLAGGERRFFVLRNAALVRHADGALNFCSDALRPVAALSLRLPDAEAASAGLAFRYAHGKPEWLQTEEVACRVAPAAPAGRAANDPVDPERLKKAPVVLRVLGRANGSRIESHAPGRRTAAGAYARVLRVFKNEGPEKGLGPDDRRQEYGKNLIEIFWDERDAGLPAVECTVYLVPFQPGTIPGQTSYRFIGEARFADQAHPGNSKDGVSHAADAIPAGEGRAPAGGLNSPTAAHLGPADQWPRCAVALNDVHPLWGGVDVHVAGSGVCVVRVVARGGKEKRFTIRLTDEESAAFRRLCVENDLVALQMPDRPGQPDEARPAIVLRNAAGGTKTVRTWAGDKIPRFDAVSDALRALAKKTEGLKAEFEGQHDPRWNAAQGIPHVEYGPDRASSQWVPGPDGKTQYAVDRGIAWRGVAVYLSLTFQLLAVDVETKRSLWCEDVGGFWSRITFREVEPEPGRKVWAVELRPNPGEAHGLDPVQYHDLRTGKVIKLPEAGNEPAGSRVALKTPWNGSSSRIGKPFALLITSEENWKSLRDGMFGGMKDGVPPAASGVDFAKDRILVVSDGDRVNVFGIKLESAFEDENRILLRLQRGGIQTYGEGIASRPFIMIAVPRREGKAIVVETNVQSYIGGPPLWKPEHRIDRPAEPARELDGLPSAEPPKKQP